jgi:4-methyl-5(b-hydroxyethyl)-thiazole monophosphate biosynthesis
MVYVFLADGFEEMEAVAPIDILRRLKIEVTTVGVTGEYVTGSHGITVKADTVIDDENFDDVSAVVLPGGMPGTLNLGNNEKLCALLKKCAEEKILISALCAAPSVLGKLSILKGREFTCYPSFEEGADGIYKNEPLVISENDGTVITAWGPGAAYKFGFALAEYILKDKNAVENLKKSMMMCGE